VSPKDRVVRRTYIERSKAKQLRENIDMVGVREERLEGGELRIGQFRAARGGVPNLKRETTNPRNTSHNNPTKGGKKLRAQEPIKPSYYLGEITERSRGNHFYG